MENVSDTVSFQCRRNVVATATGMAGSAAWIGGLSFLLIIGSLADVVGYEPLFVCLASFDLVGAIVLWTLLRAPTHVEHGPIAGAAIDP